MPNYANLIHSPILHVKALYYLQQLQEQTFNQTYIEIGVHKICLK